MYFSRLTPYLFLVAALVLLISPPDFLAEESNLPPDPFKNLDEFPEVSDYKMKVDRTRGTFSVSAKDGKYTPGSHFGNWSWTMKSERWGNYFVALKYASIMPTKIGVQIKVGDDAVLKGYAPRTGGAEKVESMIVGLAYLPKPGEYPVGLLTGDQSNGPGFLIKGVEFIPAPENEPLGQSIDGTVQLEAKTATTYSEK